MKHALVVDDLNVSSEADDLLANLAFEPQDDAEREYHHHEADGNTPRSNVNSGTRQAMSLSTLSKHATSYGEFK
jgi:hypothetical protein